MTCFNYQFLLVKDRYYINNKVEHYYIHMELFFFLIIVDYIYYEQPRWQRNMEKCYLLCIEESISVDYSIKI
jgi:hypothetical protein